ncbi:MAG TPA: type II toxin-antitoxin system PemK/MazF family toxin [Pirellulales bacterium]|nr:type II toxin-antitoxin system PemK/MazF family toxin [Pirellulales bacterium]
MKRGDVWWVTFETATGGEIRKRRPAIIVSNNTANQFANRVQVVPISSRIEKLYPCETLVDIDGRKCKAMADQLATVSKRRLLSPLASLTSDEMHRVETILRLHLGL